jgi:hypothetical protein
VMFVSYASGGYVASPSQPGSAMPTGYLAL